MNIKDTLIASLVPIFLGFGFVIELKDLGGRQKLPKVPIMSLIEY